MRKNDFLIVRALVLISLIFCSYHMLFSLVTPLFTPKLFLDNFKMLNFVITFIGLHAIFALASFFSSRFTYTVSYNFFLLVMSVLVPVAYLFINIDLFVNITLPNFVLWLLLICFVDFQIRDIRKDLVKNYMRTLLNLD